MLITYVKFKFFLSFRSVSAFIVSSFRDVVSIARKSKNLSAPREDSRKSHSISTHITRVYYLQAEDQPFILKNSLIVTNVKVQKFLLKKVIASSLFRENYTKKIAVYIDIALCNSWSIFSLCRKTFFFFIATTPSQIAGCACVYMKLWPYSS